MRQFDNFALSDLPILLNEDTVLKRYYPLIPEKETLTRALTGNGIADKYAFLALEDAELAAQTGIPPEKLALLRGLLHLYDFKNRKLSEVQSVNGDFLRTLAENGVTTSQAYLTLGWQRWSADDAQKLYDLCDLMRLPGVKSIRATLYRECGYARLQSFVGQSARVMREAIAAQIEARHLPYAAPLLKELSTQIAVATVLPKL